MKIGDRVAIVNNELFDSCEGYIVDITEYFYYVELYKGNSQLIDKGVELFFTENELSLLPKLRLNTDLIRKEKVTKIISTEESLKDVIPFFDEED